MLFIFYKKSIQGLKLYLAQTNSLLILIFKRFRRGIINFKINDGFFFQFKTSWRGIRATNLFYFTKNSTYLGGVYQHKTIKRIYLEFKTSKW